MIGVVARIAAAVIAWNSMGFALADGTVEPAQTPRIVSLAPHLTELAFDAGIQDRLVGVVEWSDYPAAAESLPRIGDAFRFDLEKVLRLEATHALAWGGGTPPGAVAELEALGVAVEVIEIGTLDQIGAAIERLGRLGGNSRVATAAAAAFHARLAALRTGNDTSGRAVPIFYQVSERPLFTLGSKHVINEVFGLCGAVNVFGDLGTEAASVDLEAVLARNPLAIVIGGNREAGTRTHWAAYPNLRAVACGNIVHVDPALLIRPTPRVLDGARKLCEWLDENVLRTEEPACGTDGH